MPGAPDKETQCACAVRPTVPHFIPRLPPHPLGDPARNDGEEREGEERGRARESITSNIPRLWPTRSSFAFFPVPRIGVAINGVTHYGTGTGNSFFSQLGREGGKKRSVADTREFQEVLRGCFLSLSRLELFTHHTLLILFVEGI